MGIREDYQKNKKGRFRFKLGPTTILMVGFTEEEAMKRLKEIEEQKITKSDEFFELLENIGMKDMEV